jgi:hypothetical protein
MAIAKLLTWGREWRLLKILEPELQRATLLILHPLGLHLA